MNAVEKRLTQKLKLISHELMAATQGLQIQAHVAGKKRISIDWGTTYPFYDLASLTKILFSATWCAHLVSQKKIDPGQSVKELWPDYKWGAVTLEKLWTHTAGLPWWVPIYKGLRGSRRSPNRWLQLEAKLQKMKPKKTVKSVYSDPDLLLNAAALLHATDSNLESAWSLVQSSGWTRGLHFNLGARRKFAKSSYAPTERCQWRRRVLQGEVHDENTWSLGGIAPHAGLFGSIDDVAMWGMDLRHQLRASQSSKKSFVRHEVIQKFVRRQISPRCGDWGWLFMKPSKGSASCGKYFSRTAFGHTGFTGTSFWQDPKVDLQIVILSNRVHPTRENRKFVELRPRLHDLVYESIFG